MLLHYQGSIIQTKPAGPVPGLYDAEAGNIIYLLYHMKLLLLLLVVVVVVVVVVFSCLIMNISSLLLKAKMDSAVCRRKHYRKKYTNV